MITFESFEQSNRAIPSDYTVKSFKEVMAHSVSLEESEQRVDKLIRDFYSAKVK